MGHPWTDVTFVGVYWNDPERVDKLLKYVRPWFTNIVVGVQTDDDLDSDPTFAAARNWADLTITERVMGHCEPTISNVLSRVKTDWSFLVSADEWPSENLLAAFQNILDEAKRNRYDGFWIRVLSSIEGVSYPSEQDNHLRVFRTALGWPRTMHSRPEAKHPAFWNPEDILHHDRSLDEMIVDYLRYWKIGAHNPGWVKHNREMMYNACTATAAHKGWAFVQGFEWWPQVRDIAFEGKDQEEQSVGKRARKRG